MGSDAERPACGADVAVNLGVAVLATGGVGG